MVLIKSVSDKDELTYSKNANLNKLNWNIFYSLDKSNRCYAILSCGRLIKTIVCIDNRLSLG